MFSPRLPVSAAESGMTFSAENSENRPLLLAEKIPRYAGFTLHAEYGKIAATVRTPKRNDMPHLTRNFFGEQLRTIF